jgi:hypothetical protein
VTPTSSPPAERGVVRMLTRGDIRTAGDVVAKVSAA